MQLSKRFPLPLALALTSLPTFAQLPAEDLLLGGPLRVSQMGEDGDTLTGTNFPHVAYNPSEDEFLVVWEGRNDTASPTEVYGQLVDASSGLALGDDFRINSIGADVVSLDTPRVAYCSSNDSYLVVWSGAVQLVPGGAWDSEIWAQFVDGATGALIGSSLRLSTMGATDGEDFYRAENPDVIYNPEWDEFLVVWQGSDDDSGLVTFDYDIFGQRLSPTGEELGTDDFRISDMGGLPFGTDAAVEPSVEWSPESQTYLVAWRNDDDELSPREVYTQFLDVTGALVGDRLQISSGSQLALDPQTAYNPDRQEFLLVWESQTTAHLVELRAQRIDATTGLEVGAEVKFTGLDTGISDSGARDPQVVYCATRELYFVACHDDLLSIFAGHQEVYGQWLDAETLAEVYADDFAVTQTGLPTQEDHYSRHVGLALREGTDEVLVVYMAATGEAPLAILEREIYAQRLRAPIGAQESVRVGTPPNPNVLLPGQTSGPVLGATWDPLVDHTSFLPNAQLDVLGIHAQALELPSNIGTFLALPAPNSVYLFSTPGVGFASPTPVQLSLMGAQLTAQAASIDGATVALTNALDIVIGAY